jgi:hypothetical protein
MLGAGSYFPLMSPDLGYIGFFPMQEHTRLRTHDNSNRQWGKSFADDFARTGYCKRQSGLAATIR